MASLDFITFAVLALAVGGLAAVLWEILVKDPRSLIEMTTDSRRFAEPSLAGEENPPARRSAGYRPGCRQSEPPRLAA